PHGLRPVRHPRGQQEIGETISQTVIREVREETGIDVEPIRVTVSTPTRITSSDGEVRQEFSICFAAQLIGGALRTSGESSEVLWGARDELDSLNIHPSIRLRIEHADQRRERTYFT
ncbi:MAG TPA: NUDIX domain-containing protein, partial [Pseudonocardiaceae bacterium]|nr:NUDIX domain-containing protein [Pseudonocardiaceae bacterium]